MALDLVEEMRSALVDRFTLRLLGQHKLGMGDFTDHRTRGTRLTRKALKVFFEEYEEFLTTPWSAGGKKLSFRSLFRRQAECLARAILGEEKYEAFRWTKDTVWAD